MTLKGHVQNGIVVIDEPSHLAEGEEVEVVVKSGEEEPEQAQPRSLYERLKPFIGMADGLPEDGSVNLDHYLYGAPKE